MDQPPAVGSSERSARRARVAERQQDKFGARRAELAEAALHTLAELGYARTSLREIAQNSSYSHGVLHYYFADKFELITACVRQYKAGCVHRYDQIVTHSRSAPQLRVAFARGLAQTMVEDGKLHRLWYDLRSQSMFEPAFRDDVASIDTSLRDMIWRIVSRYAELADVTLTVTPDYAYALFDGIFQHALIAHLAGDSRAGTRMRRQVGTALDALVAGA